MFKELIYSVSELPTPDVIVEQIIATASNPNVSAKELEKVIAQDVGLSTKVLKLVNSAYYGLPRKISKLSEAIMILGFKTVRNLALSVFTYSALKASTKSKIDHDKLWAHFMLTAIFSENIAKYVGYMRKEEAFMSGMLHDVGKIALDILAPEYFYHLAIASEKIRRPIFKIEYDNEFESHTELGGDLLELWKLPEEYVAVAQLHELPSLSPDSPYIEISSIVHLANFYSNLILPGYSYSYGNPFLDQISLKKLALKPSQLQALLNNLTRVYEKSIDMLKGGIEDETRV